MLKNNLNTIVRQKGCVFDENTRQNRVNCRQSEPPTCRRARQQTHPSTSDSGPRAQLEEDSSHDASDEHTTVIDDACSLSTPREHRFVRRGTESANEEPTLVRHRNVFICGASIAVICRPITAGSSPAAARLTRDSTLCFQLAMRTRICMRQGAWYPSVDTMRPSPPFETRRA